MASQTNYPILSCVQPLPAAYITNTISNNSTKLLTRILALEFLPSYFPAIIIYEFHVVQDLHHNRTSTTYTSRHIARQLYSSIFIILSHRLHHIPPIMVGTTVHLYIHQPTATARLRTSHQWFKNFHSVPPLETMLYYHYSPPHLNQNQIRTNTTE